MMPMRCFTCGKLIADLYEEFVKRVKEGEPIRKVLDDLKVKRYCCRRMFLTYVELTDEVLKFPKAIPKGGVKEGPLK